jgi:hypothetical protein
VVIRNKLAEFKVLEDERKYYGHFENKNEFVDWFYRGDNSFNKRNISLREALSEIENYVIKKRKRVWIPESLTNPFFLEYKPIRSFTEVNACINFPKSNTRKAELDLTGMCKTEYETIIKMVNLINKNRTIKSNQKYEVLVSPIRTSLRGKPIKNSFAIKIIYPDGSVSCFFHLIGMYHIATNIV